MVKNYAAANSIHHEIEYAHAMTKQLNVVAKENFTIIYDPSLYGSSSNSDEDQRRRNRWQDPHRRAAGRNTNVAAGTGIGVA